MNDLEVCKAIAELEGKTGFQMYKGDPCVAKHEGWATLIEYNPITDLALNYMLRDKYQINIFYSTYPCGAVLVSIDIRGHNKISAIKIEEIHRAVCECILKSKGKYHVVE